MWITNDTTKLTVELRELVENGIDIWDFDYPSFYKGEEKTAFERKVIDHYYFRQIGQETPARWLHYFRSRIREIMPYYIQLYESEKYMKDIEDPFATVDYTETFRQTSTDERTGESSATSSGSAESSATEKKTTEEARQNKFSDTPQGTIVNLDSFMTEARVEDNNTTDEAENTSNVTETGTSTATTSGSSSGTIEHTLTKKGAMGVTTFGHDMMEYRQSFLNIDLMVIKELNDLFIQVY